MFIFAYGSLMNPRSREKTLPGDRTTIPAMLNGFERIVNAPVDNLLYLNIRPQFNRSVRGVLIPVSPQEINKLKKREPGYALVPVREFIEPALSKNIFTFIAPNKQYLNLRIPRSYLVTCLAAIPESQRARWLEETVIENLILEDCESPEYKNVVVPNSDILK